VEELSRVVAEVVVVVEELGARRGAFQDEWKVH